MFLYTVIILIIARAFIRDTSFFKVGTGRLLEAYPLRTWLRIHSVLRGVDTGVWRLWLKTIRKLTLLEILMKVGILYKVLVCCFNLGSLFIWSIRFQILVSTTLRRLDVEGDGRLLEAACSAIFGPKLPIFLSKSRGWAIIRIITVIQIFEFFQKIKFYF